MTIAYLIVLILLLGNLTKNAQIHVIILIYIIMIKKKSVKVNAMMKIMLSKNLILNINVLKIVV